MKKHNHLLLLLLVAATIVSTFAGCKRGEDDPFSLRSRANRLSQPWIMTQLTGSRITAEGGNSTTISYSFSSGTINVVESPGTTKTFPYLFYMDINKDGSYEAIERLTFDQPDTTTVIKSIARGFWSWGGDGNGKSTVFLDLPGVLRPVTFFDIPRLAWDELRLTANFSQDVSSAVDGNTKDSWNFEVVFEPFEGDAQNLFR